MLRTSAPPPCLDNRTEPRSVNKLDYDVTPFKNSKTSLLHIGYGPRHVKPTEFRGVTLTPYVPRAGGLKDVFQGMEKTFSVITLEEEFFSGRKRYEAGLYGPSIFEYPAILAFEKNIRRRKRLIHSFFCFPRPLDAR